MIKTVTIQRSRWGTGNEGKSLLNKVNKKMCCLGFCAIQAGFSPRAIVGRDMPSSLVEDALNNKKSSAKVAARLTPLLHDKIRCQDNQVVERLATVNDSMDQKYQDNPKLREREIKRLFRKLKIRAVFVD